MNNTDLKKTFKITGENRYVYPEFDYDFQLEELVENFSNCSEIASYYYDYEEEEYVVVTKNGTHYPAAFGPRESWHKHMMAYKHRSIVFDDIKATIDHFNTYGIKGALFYLDNVLKQYLDYREFKKLKKYIFSKIENGGITT